VKVLFLDIDGVLLPFDADTPGCTGPDEHFPRSAVSALNGLTTQTGCKIVLTSTWRCIECIDVPAIFKEEGISGEIIGGTPTVGTRAEEIAAWLAAVSEPVESFAIIDDFDRGLSEAFPGRFVKTDPLRGLTEEETAKAARILSI
jgi:hypothetical protein